MSLLRIADFCRLAAITRTECFQMINSGEIKELRMNGIDWIDSRKAHVIRKKLGLGQLKEK